MLCMPREHGDERALCELATNGEVGQAGDAGALLGHGDQGSIVLATTVAGRSTSLAPPRKDHGSSLPLVA